MRITTSAPLDLAGVTSSQSFGTLVEDLLATHELRGEHLTELCQFVLANGSKMPWLTDFQWLLFMPRFINLAFVDGACNADCRMCSAGRGKPFRHITLEQLRLILKNTPTADDIVFSAGSSDPLMHPDFLAAMDLIAEHHIGVGFFTNGLALDPAMADAIVERQAVDSINVSLDAATPETYARIRRRSFVTVTSNINYLARRTRERGSKRPILSLSMVEMADNIEELPALVDYAASVNAWRVYVESLIQPDSENRSALDNPQWQTAVLSAIQKAQNAGIILQLPSKLSIESVPDAMNAPTRMPATGLGTPAPNQPPTISDAINHATAADDRKVSTHAMGRPCCAWLRGIWIEIDGRISPCCLTHPRTLGNIFTSELRHNRAFLLGKMKLFTGRIYRECLQHVNNCLYLTDVRQRSSGARQPGAPDTAESGLRELSTHLIDG